MSQVMQAFRTFLSDTDMLAYLATMAPRLMELRRVLKPTGSIQRFTATSAMNHAPNLHADCAELNISFWAARARLTGQSSTACKPFDPTLSISGQLSLR